MKLLLLAALRNRRHFVFAILTFFSLIFATVANQLEMCTLGVIVNTGTDAFSLFRSEKKQEKFFHDRITLEGIQKKWDKIDQEKKGYITKQDAATYVARKRDPNPLTMLVRKVSAEFDLERNFTLLMVVLACVALFKAFSLFISRYTTELLSIKITRDLRQQFFEHMQRQPMSFYHDYNMGSLSTRSVADASQIASSLNSFLTNYLQTPYTIISSLTVCFFLSWELSLVIFVGIPFVVLPVIWITKKVKGFTRQLQKNQETFTSVLLDFLSGIQTVKMFAMEGFSLKKFKEQNDRMAFLEKKSAKYDLLTRPLLHIITTASLSFVILFGLYGLSMGVGQLIVFCGMLHLFYEPVKKFAEQNLNVQKGVIASERMFEILNLTPQIQDHDNAIELKTFSSEIVFDRVSFRYKDEWILKDLSFSVKKGETVAIVGPTGAGKSTLVHLLPRLYEVQEGQISIDGIPINQVTQKSLRQLIGFVPQKPFLFNDTIAENISFGHTFSLKEIEEAAKKAQAEEFIVSMPKKYQTVLLETGKSLSGGQQQRLAIARALVKKAPILVMDEATSSLDSISEMRIKMAIQGLHKEETQILIAHRLSTIEHADKILFLEKGRKIAMGTKDELLQNCPAFKEMWEVFHHSQDTTLKK